MFYARKSSICPGKYHVTKTEGHIVHYVDKEGHLTEHWSENILWDTERDANEFCRTLSNLDYYRTRKQELIESFDGHINGCERHLKELATPKIKVGDKFLGLPTGCKYIVIEGNKFVCYDATKGCITTLGRVFTDTNILLTDKVYKRI